MTGVNDFGIQRFPGQGKKSRRDIPLLDGDGISRDRYIPIGQNQYFDTLQRVIIERIGKDIKIVGLDRRTTRRPVARERRRTPDKGSFDWIPLGNNLFYNRRDRIIMRKMGARMVLWTRDRRKTQDDRRKGGRAVARDRRKRS